MDTYSVRKRQFFNENLPPSNSNRYFDAPMYKYMKTGSSYKRINFIKELFRYDQIIVNLNINKININSEIVEIFQIANENNYKSTLRYLIDIGANIQLENNLLLRKFARNNDFSMVKFLVAHGADIYAKHDPKLCFGSNHNTCAFSMACDHGNTKIVKFLIKRGIDVDYNNSIAIMTAMRRGNIPLIKFLINNGADIYIRNYELFRYLGYWHIVKILLKHHVKSKSNIQIPMNLLKPMLKHPALKKYLIN